MILGGNFITRETVCILAINEEFSCSSFLYYGLWYQWMVGLDFVLTAAAACELEWMVDGIRFADIPEL